MKLKADWWERRIKTSCYSKKSVKLVSRWKKPYVLVHAHLSVDYMFVNCLERWLTEVLNKWKNNTWFHTQLRQKTVHFPPFMKLGESEIIKTWWIELAAHSTHFTELQKHIHRLTALFNSFLETVSEEFIEKCQRAELVVQIITTQHIRKICSCHQEDEL